MQTPRSAARGVPGVIVALRFEARAFGAGHLRAGMRTHLDDCSVAVAGIGAQHAAMAASALLDDGVAGIASVGTAGALAPGLAPGMLILPQHVIANDVTYAVTGDWRSRIAAAAAGQVPPQAGTLLQASAAVAEVGEKQALHARTGATAVDMESGALAAIAHARGIPFVVIRVIVDAADTPLPAAALAALSDTGRLQPGALMRALLKTPGDAMALWHLGRNLARARATLDRVVRATGPGLLLTIPRAAA